MTEQDNIAPEEKSEEKNKKANQFPVLYQQIVPLLTDLHKDLKLKNNQNFSFAANVNAVPIVIQELSMAAKFFPIVFAADAPGAMLAILGIKNGQNLFVDEKGDWQPNTYVPTYMRRYPFYIARQDAESEPIICIDDTSPFFSPDGDKALFEDGKPSDDLNRIMEFTRTYQRQLELTSEYAQAIAAKGLLEEQGVSFRVGDEVKASVNGFQTIIRAKFDELDGETLKEWHGKNWLDACILHLASGSNFDLLWRMDRERNGQG